MSGPGVSAGCGEVSLLVQADLDGELGASDAARVAVHLAGCAACRAQAASLRGLSARLRREVAPAEVPERLRAVVAGMAPPVVTSRWDGWRTQGPGFAVGMALAACLALAVVPRGEKVAMADLAVDAHIRALQPGHLVDVVSTDRHTVKPWFAGRLDFSPPVRDFAGVGFPLKGGRLDYVAGRPVAGLVYGRALHVIDVLVWPGAAPAAQGSSHGYNFISWSRDGMVFWVVSDLNMAELRGFVALWP